MRTSRLFGAVVVALLTACSSGGSNFVPQSATLATASAPVIRTVNLAAAKPVDPKTVGMIFRSHPRRMGTTGGANIHITGSGGSSATAAQNTPNTLNVTTMVGAGLPPGTYTFWMTEWLPNSTPTFESTITVDKTTTTPIGIEWEAVPSSGPWSVDISSGAPGSYDWLPYDATGSAGVTGTASAPAGGGSGSSNDPQCQNGGEGPEEIAAAPCS